MAIAMVERMRQRFEHGMIVREVPAGTPSRGTIAWVHGLGESSLCFESMMRHPALAGWRHLAADLPGYGKSPWSEEPLSLEEQADRLAAWIREAAGRPVVLIGHSMGGVSGLFLCERHPDVVERFVNVEGNVTSGDCVFSGQAADLSLEAFLDGGFERLKDSIYESGVAEEALRGYYASLRMCDPRLFHRNSRELVSFAREEGNGRRIASLAIPVTCVAGVPRGLCARSRESLAAAGVPLVAIEPAGHWPFLDRPEEFAARVVAIVEGDGAGTGGKEEG
jgi:pimeloyl-ACP methyl ester carboxylesterase